MREERIRRGESDDVAWGLGGDEEDAGSDALSCASRALIASHGADERKWWRIWATYSTVEKMAS